jgi:anti-sigma B factor antagonist
VCSKTHRSCGERKREDRNERSADGVEISRKSRRTTGTESEVMEGTMRRRFVAVRMLSTDLGEAEEQDFLRDCEECLSERRPALVLDCSGAYRMGGRELWLMLCCLEEAMKRNGDVRLAAVPRDARMVLETSGVGRLFRIYETNAEAVASFRQPTVHWNGLASTMGDQIEPARNAA